MVYWLNYFVRNLLYFYSNFEWHFLQMGVVNIPSFTYFVKGLICFLPYSLPRKPREQIQSLFIVYIIFKNTLYDFVSFHWPKSNKHQQSQ